MVRRRAGPHAFGFVVSLRFRLNRDTHAVLMDEIERFKTKPARSRRPKTARIVEDLSGWKYEELWGKASRARAFGQVVSYSAGRAGSAVQFATGRRRPHPRNGQHPCIARSP